MNKIFFYLSISFWSMHTLFAQTEVAVFKNGTAFLVKKSEINAENANYILKNLPQATFGTLWFAAENNQIKQISTFTDAVKSNVPIETMVGMLMANLNKKGVFVFGDATIEGTLESIVGTMAVVKTNSGKYYTNELTACKSIEFAEKPTTQIEKKEEKKILQLEFTKKNASQSLQMMYLAKGISWVPSYHIEMMTEAQARVTLSAMLMNDLEDLENANMNLVVGVPNFAYTYLQSPLISNEGVITFLNQLNNNSNQYYRNQSNSRADIRAQSFSNVMVNDEITDSEEIPALETEGKQAEDLFFYQLKNITLKKNGRAMQDILQHNTSFEHLYEVTINANNTNSYASQNETSIENVNLVKHAILIKNDSKLPWTTGTILLTKSIDGVAKPLSQDKLNYTPVGGKVKIPITVVSDISVKDTEKEIDRKINTKQKDGYFYDLVTVEAKIDLKSFKNIPIDLKIRRTFTGQALQCSINWLTEKIVDVGSSIYSPTTCADWKITLEAGKSQTITYQYQFYVRK